MHKENHMLFSDEAMLFLKQVEYLGDEARITTEQLAMLRNVSVKMIEAERWNGTGIPFEKHGRAVRYRLGTVREHLEKMRRTMA